MADDDLPTPGPAAVSAPPAPATTSTAVHPTAPTTARTSAPAPVPESAEAPAEGLPRWLAAVLTAGLVLAALNLRPAITSLGALMEEVRAGLAMSGTVAGLLTSVPPLCFALFGIAAPRLSRRFGPGTIVGAGMAAIALGVLVRPYAGGTGGFLVASALALAGIAVSNVLLPVVIKTWFPDRVGSMTSLYSMALAMGTSLAAATTVPVTRLLGGSWQTGLTVWAALAAIAVVPWLAVPRHRGARAHAGRDGQPAPAIRITRSRTAWALTVYFACQSTAAYITMGWLPQIYRDAGVSAGTAGVLLAVSMAMGVPLSFVLPRIAARMPNQGPVVVTLGICGLISYTGLWLAPAAGAWAWALLLGVSNCAFPLALTLIGMRARSATAVAQLSAFSQCVGYLLAIPGPLLVGALYQHSGGWGLPIALMIGLMVPQIAVGILAGRDRRIDDGH